MEGRLQVEPVPNFIVDQDSFHTFTFFTGPSLTFLLYVAVTGHAGLKESKSHRLVIQAE